MNIIDAIINIIENPIVELGSYYNIRNRANSMGDALEEYIKDLFAGTFDLDEGERNERLSDVFSYLGNNSNPPDAMLKNGDAIEVKKIEVGSASLALNSSYPKHSLKADSPMISSACRDAEDWIEKDIIYAVGVVNNNWLKHLCMVYGCDYCASEDCYERIRRKIKESVEQIENIDFTETKELGHINHVDPLGITYMRVRGMWGIENPWKAFNYAYSRPNEYSTFMCIINNEKWQTFENRMELINMMPDHPELSITDIRIKNPDNPALLKDAKLIEVVL